MCCNGVVCSWSPGVNVSMWAFSNADAVELIVNGQSLGTQNMTKFGHVEWDNVPWVAGSVQVWWRSLHVVMACFSCDGLSIWVVLLLFVSVCR